MKIVKRISRNLGLRDPLLLPVSRDLDINKNHADALRHLLHQYNKEQKSFVGRLRGKYLEKLWAAGGLQAEIERQLELHGDSVFSKTGKSKEAQREEILQICTATPCLPEHYYIFSFYDDMIAEKKAGYIFDHEVKQRVYLHLRNKGFWGNRERKKRGYINLTNKVKFSAWVDASDIPHPKTLAVVSKRQPFSSLPNQDFVMKPNRGSQGSGVISVNSVADGFILNRGNEIYSAREMVSCLNSILAEAKGKHIVQELVSNHSDLRWIACNALATCRIISILNENGVPECTNAMLRLPADQTSIIDNASAGGIAVAVDMETGVLGVGRRIKGSGDLNEYVVRPDNNAQITGLQVPFFKAGLDLVTRAHCLLPERDIVIGWDIAFTETGPIVIEANRQPGLYALQQASQSPLGFGRFGELLAYHLSAALGRVHQGGV